MKRQTLIMFLALSVVTAIMGVVAFHMHRTVTSAEAASRLRTESFGVVEIRIPEGFRANRTRRNEAWEVREFQGGSLGYLQLAVEPVNATDFRETCVRWFSMPGFTAGPTIYTADGKSWFFKAVPVFGDGAYVMHKRGKRLHFIGYFVQGGLRHWIELDTANTIDATKAMFDRMLLSVRTQDGESPDPSLGKALAPITQEAGYRFLQPTWFMVAFPFVFLLPVLVIVGLLRRRSGRSPEIQPGRPIPPFLEDHLEIGLSYLLQRQFMDAAVGVDSEGLTIYTFGTPFLEIPRQSLTGRVTTGEGWFGATYVALILENMECFRKQRWKYGRFRGKLTLRIYTGDIVRLHAALAG